MVDLSEVRVKMQKAVDFVRQDVSSIRTGRATPALVENIVINAYGGTAKMKVIELASIVASDAQSLVVTPYDGSIIGDIRRDIQAANVGLTPMIDNNVIRISVPALTGERRMEYVKMLHVKLEDGRVKVRQIRHDMMTDLKRMFEEKTLNEDDRRRTEEELQKLTDKMMAEIESIGEAKQTELTAV
jgi:ribosome recycling factor